MRMVKTRRTIVHETLNGALKQDHHFTNKGMAEMIEKKAYELYQKRGCIHGYDAQDWLEAEKSVLSTEMARN